MIDSHFHLDDPRFDDDREEVVEGTLGCVTAAFGLAAAATVIRSAVSGQPSA